MYEKEGYGRERWQSGSGSLSGRAEREGRGQRAEGSVCLGGETSGLAMGLKGTGVWLLVGWSIWMDGDGGWWWPWDGSERERGAAVQQCSSSASKSQARDTSAVDRGGAATERPFKKKEMAGD